MARSLVRVGGRESSPTRFYDAGTGVHGVLSESTVKGEAVPRSGIIWTIVGILLIIALLIFIF